MNRSWTFGKKIAAGFALSFVLMAMIGVVAYRSVNTLSNTSQMVAHTHLVLERLADVGVTAPEDLARLMSPIGLDLGARTPEETAVAICAEIIALRTGRRPPSLRNSSGPIHS